MAHTRFSEEDARRRELKGTTMTVVPLEARDWVRAELPEFYTVYRPPLRVFSNDVGLSPRRNSWALGQSTYLFRASEHRRHQH